jgi:aldehyde reductase
LRAKGNCVFGFCTIVTGLARPARRSSHFAIAARVRKTPAQVLLASVQRGTVVLTTPRTAARARENFNISALPEDALDEINRIQSRQRFNEVVKTGTPVSFHREKSMKAKQPRAGCSRGTDT